MRDFLIYILQFSISLTALYWVYWLFLRRDTFFAVNRFYLVGGIVISAIIPLLNIPLAYEKTTMPLYILLESVTVSASKIEQDLVSHFNIYQTITIVYLTGFSIFLFRFLFQLLQISYLIKKNGVERRKGLKFVYLKREYFPFSYFNFIFINKNILSKKDLEKIIEHEKIHIQQYHSLDVILLELLTIVQWFNPVVWFYKYALKGIHEYLADEGTLASGADKLHYQKLLLTQTVGIKVNNLSNNFNQSLIKKRIIMMTKLQSKKRHHFKIFLVLPVAVFLVFILSTFSTKYVKAELNTITNQEDQKSEIFTIVEEAPKFKGGKKALQDYIISNVNYPKDARKNKIHGKVYVTFIVMKDGSINDVKVIKGVSKSIDKEALRVVSAMPNWIPGKQKGKNVNVQYNLPINFKLDRKPKGK